jgi:hypothetical protein
VPKISGLDAHLKRLRRLQGGDVDRVIGQALFVGGNRIQVAAQLSITTGSVSGKNHMPSLPGQAPNQDTGVLGNNIETIQKEPLLVEVSSNAPYAAPLELGTSKMAARPYMGPARDAKRKEVADLVAKALERVSKR